MALTSRDCMGRVLDRLFLLARPICRFGTQSGHGQKRQDREVPIVLVNNGIRSIRRQPNLVGMGNGVLPFIGYTQCERHTALDGRLNLLSGHAHIFWPERNRSSSGLWPAAVLMVLEVRIRAILQALLRLDKSLLV
jgi:hypothetical protein